MEFALHAEGKLLSPATAPMPVVSRAIARALSEEEPSGGRVRRHSRDHFDLLINEKSPLSQKMELFWPA
jgi:hypothetical protein